MREKESGGREYAPSKHGEERIENLQSRERDPRDVRMRRGGTGRRAGQYAAGWSIQCSSEEGEGQKSKIGIQVNEKAEPMLII